MLSTVNKDIVRHFKPVQLHSAGQEIQLDLTPQQILISKNLFLDYLRNNINSAIHAKNSTAATTELKKLNVILGPLGKLSTVSNVLDEEARLSFDLIKLESTITIWDSILADLDSCEKIFRNAINLNKYHLLILADKKSSHAEKQEASAVFQSLIDSHHKVGASISKLGLESYQEWCWNHQDALSHVALYVKTDSKDILLDEDIKNILKELIHINIIKNLESNCWEKIYYTSEHLTRDISSQLIPFLNRILGAFDHILSSSNNMAELRINTLDQSKKLAASASQTIEKRLQLSNKKDDTTEKFNAYVVDWFYTVKDQVFPNQDETFINLVINKIISSQSLKAWKLSISDMESLYKLIEQISDSKIKQEYSYQIQKRYPSTAIREVIGHTAANRIQYSTLTESPQLSSIIAAPLQWYQLKICLELFFVRSDLQLKIKMFLAKYITTKINNQSVASFGDIELKRHIEYLISCLYMAKNEEVDIDILFSSLKNVGLDLVLKAGKSKLFSDSEFIIGLESIRHDLNIGFLLYLRPMTDEMMLLSRAVYEKAKKMLPLTADENFQLYWKYYHQFLYAAETVDSNKKMAYLYDACIYLLQASLGGNAQAQSRMLTYSKDMRSYELLSLVNNEFKARLLKINRDSKDYIAAQWHLFRHYYLRRENHFYYDFTERLEDIINALKHLINVPAQKMIDLSDNEQCKSYQENKIAWYVMVSELLGSPLFFSNENKKNHSPFPLLSKQALNLLLTESIANLGEKDALISRYNDLFVTYRNHYECNYVETDFSNHYNILVDAESFSKSEKSFLSFIDINTNKEIARLEKINGELRFRSYGSDISLTINGALDVEFFILENSGAKTHLTADFNCKKLNLQGDVGTLLYSGSITVSRLNWEMPGRVIIAEESKLSTNNSFYKLNNFDLHGVIFSKAVSNFEIKNTLYIGNDISSLDPKMKTVGNIISSGLVTINADRIGVINGSIVAKSRLSIKTNKYLPLHANTTIQAAELSIVAPKLISDGANVTVTNRADFIIDNDITIKNKSNWNIKVLTAKANKLENFSTDLMFDTADLNILDITNHRGSVISSKDLLRLRGATLKNAGQIKFGKQLDAALDKYVLHGFTDARDVSLDIGVITGGDYIPAIIGKNANIITGVYVNAVGRLSTSSLAITSVVDITLAGLTMSSNKIKSRIFAIDLGIDVPNIPEIIADILEFTDKVSNGNYGEALEMLCTSGAVFKGSQFVTWLFKTFIPKLGAPLDLIWTIFTIVMRTPAFINQIHTLATQTNSDFRITQLYSLINTTNSLATQSVFLEGRLIGLSHGLPGLELAPTPSISTLLLDFAALALPYSSSTALFKVGGGLQVAPSISDRSLISIDQFNAQLGLNVSKSFFFSLENNTAVVANNYSQVGQRSISSGTVLASVVSTNINEDTRSGTTIANSVFRNSEHYTETTSSSTHAQTYLLNSRTANLEGNDHLKQAMLRVTEDLQSTGTLRTDTLAVESGNANYSGETIASNFSSNSSGNTQLHGHLQTSHANIVSAGNVTTDAKIDLVPEGKNNPASDSQPPSLHMAGRNIDSSSAIAGEDSNVILDAEKNVTLDGEVVSADVVVKAESIKDKAHLKIQHGDFEAKSEIKVEGKSEFQAEGKDHFIRFAADNVDMAAGSDVKGDGLLSIRAKTGNLDNNIDVSDFDLALTHLPDIEDFLELKGRYANIHASKSVSGTTDDSVIIDRKLDESRSIALTAASEDVEADIHSSHNILFTSTSGNIQIGQHTLAADQYLQLDSHGSVTGDKSTLLGYEIAIHALQKVINNGGLWGAGNFFSIDAGDDVEVNCLSSDVQGKYDTMKDYQPGYLIGGVGADHDGVGLFVQTDGKFILLGSSVESQGSNEIHAKKGIDLEALYNKYISYYKHYKNWTGRETETTDYSFQLQPAVIFSKNGSNSLFSSDGSIYSVSAEFYAGKENNLTAKHNVKLLGYILEEREVKEKRNFYVNHTKTDSRQEVAAPTEVVNITNANIKAETGDIVQTNAEVHAGGKVTETAGGNIYIETPVLKQETTIESSGFTFSTPILDLASQPLAQDYQGITQARGIAPIGAAISNSIIDSLNFANTFMAGIRNGSMKKGFLQATNLASAEVGYTHTKTTVESETVAPNSGIDAQDIELTAGGTVDVGANLSATNEVDITATNVSIHGNDTHSSYEQLSESVAVGVSAYADPTVSGSLSGASGHSTEHVNTAIVGATVNIKATNRTDIVNADIEGKNVKLKTHTLHEESQTGESSSESWSVGGSTSGQVNASFDSSSSHTIQQRTEIHGTESVVVEAVDTEIDGAAIVSDGTGSFTTDTLTTRTVHEDNKEQGFAFSGACPDLSSGDDKSNNVTIDEASNDTPGVIPTDTISLTNRNDSGKQEATIYFAKGGTVAINSTTPGSDPLNRSNPDGHESRKGTDFSMTLKVPTSLPNPKALQDNFEGAKNELFPSKPINDEDKFERLELPPQDDKNTMQGEPLSTSPQDGTPGVDHQRSISRTFGERLDEDLDDDFQQTSGQYKAESAAKSTTKSATSKSEANVSSEQTSDGSSWVNTNTTKYAQAVFTTPSFSINSSASTTAEQETNDEPEEKIFPNSNTPASSFNTAIPDPRASSNGFFGKNYRASMPVAPSADYATASVSIFDDNTQPVSYETERDFVNNPQSLELDTRHAGFQSGASQYLDDVQLAQDEKAADPMAFEQKTFGEELAVVRDETFNMSNVDAFNHAVEETREGFVHAISNPTETIKNIAITNWDTLNGIGEITLGITTQGAHDRNVASGIAYHEEFETFEYGTTTERVGIVTGIVATTIFSEAIAVPVIAGAAKIGRVGIDMLPSSAKSRAIPSEGVGRTPEIIPENPSMKVDKEVNSSHNEGKPSGDREPSRKNNSELPNDEYSEESKSIPSTEFENETPNALPARSYRPPTDVSLQSFEELTETNLPKNDRVFPPHPDHPNVGKAEANQFELLNQHGLFKDGVRLAEPLQKVAGSDVRFHPLEEAGSNSYVIHRMYEETLAGKRGGSSKGGHRRGNIEDSSSNSKLDSRKSLDHASPKPIDKIEVALLILKLPYKRGIFPFKPPKAWRSHEKLERGDQNGYVDAGLNEWKWDPSKREWDVQIHRNNKAKYKHLLKGKTYINVFTDGMITHGGNPDFNPAKTRKK